MKRKFIVLILVLCVVFLFGCQNHRESANRLQHNEAKRDSILTVVNWNVEWFGSKNHGPKNKMQQEQNTLKVLQYLKADVYGLCEIVDEAKLAKIVRFLGDNYAYVISPYASGAQSSQNVYYKEAQKMAFVYNKSVCKPIASYGLLRKDSRAGYYFAGGRYPFVFTAEVTKNNTTKQMAFVLIHAKSGADYTSYNRRVEAATLLNRAVQSQLQQKYYILMGDFNDALQGSISQGKASPYQIFTTNNKKYSCITKPLQSGGESSTLDFDKVIDHQIISAALARYYMAKSAKICTGVISVVPDYTNGNTSDHYPIMSKYLFSNNILVEERTVSDTSTVGCPNLFTAILQDKSIDITCSEDCAEIQFVLYNSENKKLLSVHKQRWIKNTVFHLRTQVLAKGNYELVIYSKNHKKTVLTLRKT